MTNDNDDRTGGAEPQDHGRDGVAAGRFTSGSSLGYYLAAGVLLLAVVGVVAVLVHPNGRSGATPAVTQTVTAAAGAGVTDGASAAVTTGAAEGVTACGFPEKWDGSPAQAAPKVTWEPVSGFVAPVSSQLGPKEISGPDGVLRQCYAHSVSGAVVAAVNITVGASVTTAGNLVVEKQFTEGAGKQEALAQEGQAGSFTIAGYQVQGCTPSKCVISVAATGDGQTVAATAPLVWSDGDWKIDGTVTGISTGGGALSSLSGYVPFSPGGAS